MSILDEFGAGKVGVPELVRHYESGADVRELVEFAKTQPDRLSALQVVAEIGPAADPIWRELIKYVNDPEYYTSYAALRMVHQRARDTNNFKEIFQALTFADIEKDAFFARAVAILRSVPPEGLQLMMRLAVRENSLGFHALGLTIMIYHDRFKVDDFAVIFRSSTKVVQLYICAVITTHFRDHPIERLLPRLVKEEIEALRRRRDKIARKSSAQA